MPSAMVKASSCTAVAPALVHMIAGDGDTVEPWHVRRAVGEDVRDDPHRGPGRIDVGVADHELLEDVVLDGPFERRPGHALLFRRDDIEGHDRDDRAVHGHGNGHLIQRDAVEQDLHVLDRVDRNARHADIAGDAGDDRCHSRDAWRDRRRPTGPSARRRDCAGRRRSTPRRSRNRHIGGSSLGGPHTWRPAPRAYKARSPAGRDRAQRNPPPCRAASRRCPRACASRDRGPSLRRRPAPASLSAKGRRDWSRADPVRPSADGPLIRRARRATRRRGMPGPWPARQEWDIDKIWNRLRTGNGTAKTRPEQLPMAGRGDGVTRISADASRPAGRNRDVRAMLLPGGRSLVP